MASSTLGGAVLMVIYIYICVCMLDVSLHSSIAREVLAGQN